MNEIKVKDWLSEADDLYAKMYVSYSENKTDNICLF